MIIEEHKNTDVETTTATYNNDKFRINNLLYYHYQ